MGRPVERGWDRFADCMTQGPVQNPEISVERRPMPGRWNWPLDGPVQLRVNAVACDSTPTPESPLPPEPVVKIEHEEDALLICSVSLAELARRLRDLGASPGEAWTLISDYVQAADEVVPVDQEVAHESYRLSVSATTRLPLADALIAAAACIRQAVLVHRDNHMRGVAGVVQQLHLDAG